MARATRSKDVKEPTKGKVVKTPTKVVATKSKKVAEVKPAKRTSSEVEEETVEAEKETVVAEELELSSEESSDDDEDLHGLSGDEESEEPSKKKSKNVTTTTKEGHSINKTIAKPTEARVNNGKRGVVYVGRIPHGFHERELKTYFSQFGAIINLRLSRNKKTGASKHFGYIEFESLDVAKVAAETMNNYLLEGHLLKVNIQESIHDELFKGANTPFNPIDWNKINREKNDNPKTAEEWKIIVEDVQKQKENKQKELNDLGFDYDLKVLLK